MIINVHLVKAFTKDSKLGNPAGVIHNADHLNDAQMLSIAHTLGFSESAFIQKSDQADYKVRFFTPKQEVEFCGHATVATFHSCIEQGVLNVGTRGSVTIQQETKAGQFTVDCYADGKVMMVQNNAVFGAVMLNKQFICSLLNIHVNDLNEFPIQVVATITPTLIVPIVSLKALRKIQPDLARISTYSKEKNIGGLYVFTTESFTTHADMYTRSFDPLVGIDEDAATGVAAGPLGCYADKYIFKGSKKQFIIEQGFDMGKDSTLYVDTEEAVRVGGYAVSFGYKALEI